MGVQDKAVEYTATAKMKWWYLPMLVLGSVMVIGGIIAAVVL